MANRHWRPERLGYATPKYGHDERLKYLVYFLDLRGQRVLELGPHSGHFTVLLDKLGAREIIGVEGRESNVELCTLARERFQLPATFVCQDIEKLGAGVEQPLFQPGFDLVFSLGLLYHLAEPKPVLAWARSMAPTLFLGTHYVERQALRHYRPPVFTDATYYDRAAKSFNEQGLQDPLGGLYPRSTWLYEDHLVEILHDVGYARVEVLGKDVQAWRPHITILASASGGRAG